MGASNIKVAKLYQAAGYLKRNLAQPEKLYSTNLAGLLKDADR